MKNIVVIMSPSDFVHSCYCLARLYIPASRCKGAGDMGSPNPKLNFRPKSSLKSTLDYTRDTSLNLKLSAASSGLLMQEVWVILMQEVCIACRCWMGCRGDAPLWEERLYIMREPEDLGLVDHRRFL